MGYLGEEVRADTRVDVEDEQQEHADVLQRRQRQVERPHQPLQPRRDADHLQPTQSHRNMIELSEATWLTLHFVSMGWCLLWRVITEGLTYPEDAQRAAEVEQQGEEEEAVGEGAQAQHDEAVDRHKQVVTVPARHEVRGPPHGQHAQHALAQVHEGEEVIQA